MVMVHKAIQSFFQNIIAAVLNEVVLAAAILLLLKKFSVPYLSIMKRLSIAPRINWQQKVEQIGFGFHTQETVYWDESVCYSFTKNEIDHIEQATASLWDLCLGAVQYVIDNNLYEKFCIPQHIIPLIEKSWMEDHPSIYGRFDLVFHDGEIKMFEFNSDTPTSLFEAAIVQWWWLQDVDASKDQFNSIHEKLIHYWKYLSVYLHPGKLHFSCLKQTLEDLTNLEYMRDCAMQAGIETSLLFVDDIGWDERKLAFTGISNEPIKNIFKLYPWEWLINDEFGKYIGNDIHHCMWIEPPWKMILSNKAILPVLWQLYEGHPFLLPAYFDEKNLSDYVRKPLLSREGANVTIVNNKKVIESSTGEYGKEGFVFQEYFSLPDFENNYPVIGSWVIGQEPAGIGIRESSSIITNNMSRFVPHFIE